VKRLKNGKTSIVDDDCLISPTTSWMADTCSS